MELLAILAIWVILCVAVSGLAARYGQSAAGYAILSFFLSPIMGLCLLLIAGRTPAAEAKRALEIRRATERLERAG